MTETPTTVSVREQRSTQVSSPAAAQQPGCSPAAALPISSPAAAQQPGCSPAVTPAPSTSLAGAAIAGVVRGLPTLLVLLGLGALAYVGHQTGWTVPKFDDLLGNRQVVTDDWCEEHSVAETVCVECDETLLPRLKSTWCGKHGVHNCPFERPDVVQTRDATSVSKEDLDRAQRALDLKDRTENSSTCKLHQRRIQFASADIIDKMGIKITPAWPGSIVETVAASGEIGFEQPSVSPLSAPVAGRVWHVTEKGALGARVKRGDVLAVIDAVEVGKAKTELLQAYAQTELRKKTVDMLKPLVAQGIVAETRLLEADLALREARIRLMGAQQTLTNMGLPFQVDESKSLSTDELAGQLHFFGIPLELASRLDARTTTANLMPVVASRDGIVTAAKAALGEMVETGKALFVVVDTTRMWLMLSVRIEDVKYLRVRDPRTKAPGQIVKFRADGASQDVTGELVWKTTEVDEKTRTVRYRATLPNADGSLLANSYGTGQIVLREEKNAVLVPNEAVHWDGDCHLVFVRDKSFFESGSKKIFHVRSVRPGVMNGPNTEIIAGVLPGEVVATTNSASLRAELLKNNLGAG